MIERQMLLAEEACQAARKERDGTKKVNKEMARDLILKDTEVCLF